MTPIKNTAPEDAYRIHEAMKRSWIMAVDAWFSTTVTFLLNCSRTSYRFVSQRTRYVFMFKCRSLIRREEGVQVSVSPVVLSTLTLGERGKRVPEVIEDSKNFMPW